MGRPVDSPVRRWLIKNTKGKNRSKEVNACVKALGCHDTTARRTWNDIYIKNKGAKNIEPEDSISGVVPLSVDSIRKAENPRYKLMYVLKSIKPGQVYEKGQFQSAIARMPRTVFDSIMSDEDFAPYRGKSPTASTRYVGHPKTMSELKEEGSLI